MTTGVRPLDVEPEPPRLGPLLAAAAMVALAGFGVFLASGGLSVSTPTTTAGPTTTTTTLPETTVAPRSANLGDKVAGFQGRVRGILSLDDGEGQTLSSAWTWSSGESEARTVPLPDIAFGAWDRDLAMVAAVAESSFGRSLFFGPPGNVREVFNDVESFAWHSTEPSTLALISAPQADGLRELWRSIPDDSTPARGTFNASRVARFDIEASLVAYADWGFALAGVSPSGDLLLTTLDPDGNLVANGRFQFLDDFGDGSLLVIAEPQDPGPRLARVDTSLGDSELVGPEAAFGGVLSPNKRWVASTSILSGGATLWITEVATGIGTPITLGVDVAFPSAWSSDGRWILLRGSPDAPAQQASTQLIFVDAGSERISIVESPGTVSSLTLEALGTAGPSRFYVP